MGNGAMGPDALARVLTGQWGMLDQVAAGTPLIVPIFWPFAIANSLLVLLRRKKILAADQGLSVYDATYLELAEFSSETKSCLDKIMASMSTIL
jgi:hypothetical protein